MSGISRNPSVLVIGAGMSGLLMGIRLLKAGVEDFRILESSQDVGGTWQFNSYPGLACDVPAYTYCFSFEPNTEVTHRYARGPQIHDYFRRMAEKYGLQRKISFGRKVATARYADQRWRVETDDGAVHEADFLINSTGPLGVHRFPDIPGIDSFAGDSWHSVRWNHKLPLADKRVGIIGTGSTATQIICSLAGNTRHLTVYQRTPQWVAPQFDKAYSGLNRALTRRVPGLARLKHHAMNFGFENVFGRAVLGNPVMHKVMDVMCKRHLATVEDPELRARLTPDYKVGCKRLIFSDGFYRAIQHPDVTLETRRIERIVPEGIVTEDGVTQALDVIVYATGFTFPNTVNMDVIGEQGRSLDAVWNGAPRGYRSIAVAGFPNYFMIFGPHSPGGNSSVIKSSEVQTAYIMQMINAWRERRFDAVEPREAAERAYTQRMIDHLDGTVWMAGCQSWYQDESGRPNLWPFTPWQFRNEMRSPEFSDFELRQPR